VTPNFGQLEQKWESLLHVHIQGTNKDTNHTPRERSNKPKTKSEATTTKLLHQGTNLHGEWF